VHELELLARVDAVEMFQPILYGTTFTIVTDNKSINYLVKQTTMGERLTRWKMFLQSYDFTIIYNGGRNNVLADTLSQIYEERTANTKAEIMEDQTINKSFSALTILLSPSQDQYLPLSYPHFTTSNTTSSSSVLYSDPGYCNYQHQPDTIAAMSGIKDHQVPSSVCDNDGCNHKHHNDRHVPIFGEEAYKIITALKDTSLQLGRKFRVFSGPNFRQALQAALQEAQKNIHKL
jgi:hypothetical protein